MNWTVHCCFYFSWSVRQRCIPVPVCTCKAACRAPDVRVCASERACVRESVSGALMPPVRT